MPHPRRTWSERLRRGAIIAAVFVLLGVVTTYLVAWVATLSTQSVVSPETREYGVPTADGMTEDWIVVVWQHSATELRLTFCALLRDSGSTLPSNIWSDRVDSTPLEWFRPTCIWRDGQREIRLVGWPLRCVWGAADFGYRVGETTLYENNVYLSPEVGAMWGSGPSGIDGRLPLGVIWSRFIPNVLIHAAILFTLWRGCVFMSRWSKRRWYTRRNRCPNCGYDRAGLTDQPVCPECGQELPSVRTLPPGGTS